MREGIVLMGFAHLINEKDFLGLEALVLCREKRSKMKENERGIVLMGFEHSINEKDFLGLEALVLCRLTDKSSTCQPDIPQSYPLANEPIDACQRGDSVPLLQALQNRKKNFT